MTWEWFTANAKDAFEAWILILTLAFGWLCFWAAPVVGVCGILWLFGAI